MLPPFKSFYHLRQIYSACTFLIIEHKFDYVKKIVGILTTFLSNQYISDDYQNLNSWRGLCHL